MRTKKENRVICKCVKCNKLYSYDKTKNSYKFGQLCRECYRKAR